jgi:hypothetical protein
LIVQLFFEHVRFKKLANAFEMTFHPPLKFRLILPIFAFRLMSSSRRSIWGEARSGSAQPVFCAEHTQGARVQQQVLTVARRQPDPARDKDAERVSVRKQCDVTAGRAGPGNHPVHSCTNLFGRLASLHLSRKTNQPGAISWICLGVSPSYLP